METLIKVDSVARGIYGTSARNLTIENALPVASFLATPDGPLSLRNGYIASRPLVTINRTCYHIIQNR